MREERERREIACKKQFSGRSKKGSGPCRLKNAIGNLSVRCSGIYAQRQARRSCPDAETLAAYHERTLLPEERMQCKEHIRGCARCQETLALLAETDAIELPDGEEKRLAQQGTVLAASAALAASPRSLDRGAVALKEASEAEARPRNVPQPKSWRWVVPAGALAAALIVFLAVRENQRTVSRIAKTQMAENRAAPMPPPASQPIEQPPADETRNARREPEAPPGDRLRGLEQSPAVKGPAGSPETAASAGPATAPHSKRVPGNTKASPELQEGTVRSFGMGARAETKRTPSALQGEGVVPPPPAVSDTAAAGTPAPAATTPAATGGSPDRAKKTRQDSEERAEALRSMTAAQALEAEAGAAHTAPEPSAGNAMELKSESQVRGRMLREVAESNPHVILAPDGKHAWRVGSAGFIESSSDAGRSWKTQKSKVSADLTAGSAPSDTVCWLVGKAGIILLTQDGGKHWKRVESPFDEDLGAVHARDGLHASISSADKRRRLETADGGTTWTPATNE